MLKYFIATAIFATMAVAVAFLSPPAGAFVANQNGAAQAATATNTIVEVKHKGTPPGWHHGRKVGWHGHARPPGQL